MIFHQYVIYVLIYNYLKFRKDPSITSQEIANYISVALALALSVYYSINCFIILGIVPPTTSSVLSYFIRKWGVDQLGVYFSPAIFYVNWQFMVIPG